LIEWLKSFQKVAPRCLSPNLQHRLITVEETIMPTEQPVDRTHIIPYLVYSKQGKQKTFDIIEELLFIGRTSSAGPFTNKNGEKVLSIKDNRISRQHAKIIYKNNQCTLIDLGPKTEINSQRFESKVLTPGDRIRLGRSAVHCEEVGKVGGDGETLKEGWLMKKSPSLTGKYQNRYCILKAHRFYYLVNPQDDRVKGIVDLSGIEVKEEGETGFSIITRERKFHVKAANTQERDQWVHQIDETRKIHYKKEKNTVTNDNPLDRDQDTSNDHSDHEGKFPEDEKEKDAQEVLL